MTWERASTDNKIKELGQVYYAFVESINDKISYLQPLILHYACKDLGERYLSIRIFK
jgi:hypothetical protein